MPNSEAIRTRAAYREPAYRRFVAGQAVSVLGDQVWFVALSWAAVRVASPAVAGVIVSLSAVPRLALMVFGGPLVDRLGPRRLMVASDALRAVSSLVAAGLALRYPTVGLLIAVALVFGVVDAVFLPAVGALQPRLLTAGQLSSGAALREVSLRAALTLGAPLGGVLVAGGGLPLACAANAATFVVSMVAIWSVRPRPATAPGPPERYLVALRSGLAYLARHRVLRANAAALFVSNVGFVGPMNVGLALLAQQRGWGPSGIGLMLAGFGLGAAGSAAALLRMRVKGQVGILIAAAAATEGAALFGIAVAPVLPLAVAAAGLVGVASGPFGVLSSALTQTFTADRFRGRVASITQLANLGVSPLAMTATAAVVGAFGVVIAFTGSLLLQLTATGICLLVPELRRARLHAP